MEISQTWEGKEQPHDETTAGSPWFYKSSYREFHKGLKLALQELEKFSALIAELELEASPYNREKDRLKRMINHDEETLKINEDTGEFDEVTISGISYGSLRYLKAGILLRVQNLIEKRRKVFKENQFVPRSIVQSFDERIQQLLNLAEQGKLNSLRPADIFFEIVPRGGLVSEKESPHIQSVVTGLNYTSTDVPIIDPVLRTRCLNILRAVTDGGNEEHLDSVIREMSVVLEDRVRAVSQYDGQASGAELFSAVMTGTNPKIKFSDRKEFQDSAHLLFRGYSGFIRNESMHKLVPSYTEERVLQLLGMVDYLLFLLSRAETKPNEPFAKGLAL